MKTWIALVVLMAGCIGELAHPAPTETAAPEDSPLVESPREVFRVPNAQREAFVAVGPDGQEILACAHGAFERPSWMFASTDGGHTFHELRADVPGVAGDCEVAYAEDGTWAFLHSTVGATVATTSDQGSTWTVTPLAIVPPGGADRPWMAYVNNTLMVVYQPAPLAPGHAGFVKSDDHGATWSVGQAISPVDAQSYVSLGRILHDPAADTLYVPMYRGNEIAAAAGQNEAADVEFGVATSRDRGDTWSYQVLHRGAAAMSTPTGVGLAGDVIPQRPHRHHA